MKPKNNTQDIPPADILAQAKAIRMAVKHGALPYSKGKAMAESLLEKVNKVCERIAKKYRRGYRKIRFTDL